MLPMMRPTLVALLFFARAGDVFATEQLTQSSYESYVTSGKNGMIKFYQTWCGHCTRMKPDWDQLAEEAHSSVFIKDVNCGDQLELCEVAGVTGYPTIRYWIDGNMQEYTGGRGYDELAAFVHDLATKCDIKVDPEGTCSPQAQKYAAKWLSNNVETDNIANEITRLKQMQERSMKAELKNWIKERIHILKQVLLDESKEEL